MTITESNSFIHDICRPFFEQHPVEHFDYQRYYDDGRHVQFCTAPLFMDQYLNKNLYPQRREFEAFSAFNYKWTYLSESMPMPAGAVDICPEKYINNIFVAKEFGIFNRIYFVKKYADFFLCCGFGTAINTPAVFEFYMNNQAILEGFIFHFESSAKKEIQRQLAGSPIILANYHSPSSNLTTNQSEPTINALLTPRELEISTLYLHGISSKSIARVLDASPRTIENHIYNIRIKLGVDYKNKLLKDIKMISSMLKLSNSPASEYLQEARSLN